MELFETVSRDVEPTGQVDVDNGTPGECYTELLTGSAGTGKTYEINQRLKADPRYGLLCATTGIAAINMGEGVTTINAALKYFNTESLTDAYVSGQLVRQLRRISNQGYRNLVVDEVSMMPAEQLDTLIWALDALAGQSTAKPLGLVLTGDMCQLPPIPVVDKKTGRKRVPWIFEAEAWLRFARNTVRLTKCWRQADGPFLEALGYMRQGQGAPAAELLNGSVEYALNDDREFVGSSIKSTNEEVERFNRACHQQVQGRAIETAATRWTAEVDYKGQPKYPAEWKHVPDTLRLKEGAYVMILANQRCEEYDGGFLYVNGDCGWVRGFNPDTGALLVELKRSGKVVDVEFVTRRSEQKEEPLTLFNHTASGFDEVRAPHYDEEKKRWVLGEIRYMPLRLAYATTVHKAQGLTLDAVQINLSNAFFGQPAMAYVAFSRCRSAQGLRVVGSPELLRRRVCVDPKVVRFL